MNPIAKNFEKVHANIRAACTRVGRRENSVQIVAVTKKQSLESIQMLAEHAKTQGLPLLLGENYVQEYRSKRSEIKVAHDAHLIGPLQRNKAKDAVSLFSVIESVHSVEVAQAIHRAAAKEKKLQNVYLQVNVSDDDAKSGFPIDQVESFLLNTAPALSHIRVVGLMTITKLYKTAEEARPDFKRLYDLKEQLGMLSFELSMGMSADYQVAVEEGATIVRIGTAIFGPR